MVMVVAVVMLPPAQFSSSIRDDGQSEENGQERLVNCMMTIRILPI
jgi:hypothetical protein